MKTISKLRASLFFLFLFLFISHSHAIQLTLVNTCDHSIWPGIQGSTGTADVAPSDGGFHLPAGEEAAVNVPNGWSGRIWARQGCCFDERGHGSCQTGDCGGRLHCRGSGGAPPATLVEMTFGVDPPLSPVHFYDVSLVDGFNLPVKMAAVGDGGGGYVCGEAGCKVNVNGCCPSRFEVRAGEKTVGCKSACLALQTDKYCCRGEYGSASSCRPTLFSYIFKALCPRAYSFAYDDAASLVSCRASRYVITFCPGA